MLLLVYTICICSEACDCDLAALYEITRGLFCVHSTKSVLLLRVDDCEVDNSVLRLGCWC